MRESHSHVVVVFFGSPLTAPTLLDLKLSLTCWAVMAPSCVSAGQATFDCSRGRCQNVYDALWKMEKARTNSGPGLETFE